MIILFFLLGFLLLLACAYVWIQVRLARSVAIRDRKNDVSLFGGILRLLLWEPNEGLVILKNKQISEVIPSGDVTLAQQGGTKFISPFLGQELRARIPLALRMVTWEDQNILTRESIQVKMKVAVWWKVNNLSAYVFNISKSIHVEQAHHDVNLVEAAEAWLKTMTESTLRLIVSHASIASLVSSKATSYLKDVNRHNGEMEAVVETSGERGTPESIAGHLRQDLGQKVSEYGIEVQRVEIQEVSLSRDIQEAIDKVWRAYLLPVQTEQEARARQIELRSLGEVIGLDAVAMNELLKNFKGASYIGPMPFMDGMFQNVGLPSQRRVLGDGKAQVAQQSRIPAPAKEIKFACPECGGHVKGDESIGNSIVECPHCKKDVQMYPL